MENNTTSNQHHQPPICANQNLMHVKFHVNKFQDNLLSKRLKQLNNEEMKTRLKHQRTSNELIYFLRECQKSTGYYSKMNEYKRGGGMKSNEEATVIEKCISLCPTTDSTSTTSTRTSLSSHVIRPSTGRFRSSSYSNCFPQLKNDDGRKLLARRSIDESATHRASLFIDAATALSTSTPNTPNSNSSGIANISSSKTSTSRSSNSSNSAFSSNSSESFGVVDSSSMSSSAASRGGRDFRVVDASRVLSTSNSTRTTVSIIRPQTAQLSSKKLLFTKLPQPKICNASKKSRYSYLESNVPSNCVLYLERILRAKSLNIFIKNNYRIN